MVIPSTYLVRPPIEPTSFEEPLELGRLVLVATALVLYLWALGV